MPSFPLINEIPAVLDTTGWIWEPFIAPHASSYGFWIGCDQNGDKWLTKLRGASYAYREIVFARLAQRMGWSCQSSAFLRLDKGSARMLGKAVGEVHAAHWFLKEHPSTACSAACPFRFLLGRSVETVDDLCGSEIEHLLDWPRSEFAACLFGANEPPGRLITVNHEFVIIDAEEMFLTGPCHLEGTSWWNLPNGKPSQTGRALALQVCSHLCGLSAADIDNALSIPNGVATRKIWPVSTKLKASREFAAEFQKICPP